MNKIYTFLLHYSGDDGFNSISYCAETVEEAKKLYHEEFKDNPPRIESIEVVYMKEDAEEYGNRYGTPEEYEKMHGSTSIEGEKLIPINYTCFDILENEGYDDLIYFYAEAVHAKEDCSSADEFLSQVLAIEYFPDMTFHHLLSQYFEEQGKSIEDEVRGYYPYKLGFLMTHGVGYAWESADLFGGTADGRAKQKFKDWLDKKGFELVSEEGY